MVEWDKRAPAGRGGRNGRGWEVVAVVAGSIHINSILIFIFHFLFFIF
jgi:hypothetical protein